MAHVGKRGRVVDASGNGVSQAAVIATAKMTCSGSFGPETRTSTETEYRVVTVTDEKGTYAVPSTWYDLNVAHLFPFSGGCSEHWTLTAFKLGYVLSDDEWLWARRDISNPPVLPPLFSSEGRPSALWLVLFARVDPIQLDAHELPLGDEAKYSKNVLNSGGFPDNPRRPTRNELSMRRTAAAHFSAGVCGLDPDDRIDWGATMSQFAQDDLAFLGTLDGLDPEGFEISRQHGGLPVFRAGTICEAMRLNNGGPS